MRSAEREDVIRVLDELLAELKSNPGSWENPILDRYLAAMRAWLEDTEDDGRKLSWDLVIDMLRAGQVYE